MANYEQATFIVDLLTEDHICLLKSYLTLYKPNKETCQLAMKKSDDFPVSGSDIDQFFLQYVETKFANIPAADELLKQVQQLKETNAELLATIAKKDAQIKDLQDNPPKYINAEDAFNNFLTDLKMQDKDEIFHKLVQTMDFEIIFDNVSKLAKWFNISEMVFKNRNTVLRALEYLFFDGDVEQREHFMKINNFTDLKELGQHLIDNAEDYIEQNTMIDDFKEFLVIKGYQSYVCEFERNFELAIANHYITKHAKKSHVV